MQLQKTNWAHTAQNANQMEGVSETQKPSYHSLFSMPKVLAQYNPMQLAGTEVQVLELRTLWVVSYCVRYFLMWESNRNTQRDFAALLAVVLAKENSKTVKKVPCDSAEQTESLPSCLIFATLKEQPPVGRSCCFLLWSLHLRKRLQCSVCRQRWDWK